jgi:hypothetical protein
MKTKVSVAKSSNYIYIGRRKGYKTLSRYMGENFTEHDSVEDINELQAKTIVRCAWALMKPFSVNDRLHNKKSCVFWKCYATERLLDNYLEKLSGVIVKNN